MTEIIHDLSSLGKGGVHFVVSSGVEKPNQELRKLIRSHVMLGKNKGKTLPPRKKKPKAKASENKESHESPSSSGTLSARTLSSDTSQDLIKYPNSSALVAIPTQRTVPRQFGSFLAAVPFADAAVEAKTVEVVIQFSLISKQTMFPNLEPCIFFDRRAESWIMPLGYDPAFLHAMIFTSQYYFATVASRQRLACPVSTSTISQQSQPHFPHLAKTLQLLRERLAASDEISKLSLTTAAAIMALVGHAHMSGDKQSAKYHMEGLGKIVGMRGGVGSFQGSEKLLLEIFRCDIGIALHGGSRPVFFNDVSQMPFVPYPDLRSFLDPSTLAVAESRHSTILHLENFDVDLCEAWGTMSDFCILINLAAGSGQRISTMTFSDTMSSVMYRLLNMAFPFTSKNEAIRLGMLAFTSSVFLHWNYLGMGYPHLSAEYRRCLQTVKAEDIPPKLMAWLLMVGSMTVFKRGGSDDKWLMPLLQENLRSCEINGWDEMRALLNEFMSIGLVFDRVGKRVFELVICFSSFVPGT